MPFKGHFDSFFITKVFQLLCEEKKSGVLTLRQDGDLFRVVIKDGKIVYVQGVDQERRIGRYLVREGLISENDLARVLEEAGREGLSFGKILIRSNLVTASELKKSIEGQAVEILYEIFTWESGEFDFREESIDGRKIEVFELNMMKLIFDAVCRMDELKMFEKNIPTPDLVLKISRQLQKEKSIALDADAWHILSMIDGKRTVGRIIDESDYGKFEVYKVVNAMLSSGIVERAATRQEKAAAGEQDNGVREKMKKEGSGKSIFSIFKRK